MLKLKFEYFCHLIWRSHSLEKILMLGKIEGRRNKGMTEDEMAGWHHQLNGHEFEHESIFYLSFIIDHHPCKESTWCIYLSIYHLSIERAWGRENKDPNWGGERSWSCDRTLSWLLVLAVSIISNSQLHKPVGPIPFPFCEISRQILWHGMYQRSWSTDMLDFFSSLTHFSYFSSPLSLLIQILN